MNLVDVHCHLNHAVFKDKLDQIIDNAKSKGVKAIITSGTNPSSNLECLKLAEKYSIVKCSFGFYPTDLLGLGPDESGIAAHKGDIDLDEEFKFIKKNQDKIIAVGEVGLDFKVVKDKNKEQMDNFQKIIELTKRLNKPIVIHSRNAEEECINLLESNSMKRVLMHCFSGRKSLIKRASDLGYYFSIPPVIARLQHFQTLVDMVPLQQLLTETDAPWLSHIQGVTNEPAFVVHSISRIAEIKKLTLEEASNIVFLNYKNLFE